MKREEAPTEKRKPLTPWELATLYLEQQGKCNHCGDKIHKGYCDDDHEIPLACGGSNELKNRQLLCPPCHKVKTRKDKEDIARIARRKGATGQYARRQRNGPQIKSRGFDKTLRKKMDGTVEKRKINHESK